MESAIFSGDWFEVKFNWRLSIKLCILVADVIWCYIGFVYCFPSLADGESFFISLYCIYIFLYIVLTTCLCPMFVSVYKNHDSSVDLALGPLILPGILFSVFSSDLRFYLSLWRFQGSSDSTVNSNVLTCQHFLRHLLSVFSPQVMISRSLLMLRPLPTLVVRT